jgi:aspartokinase
MKAKKRNRFVMKFGGSSVGNIDKIRMLPKRVIEQKMMARCSCCCFSNG